MTTLLLGMGVLLHGQEARIPLPGLLEDFQVLQTALQEAHPGLYRYSPKESMDALFETYEQGLHDSLTVREFYQYLLPLVDQVQCGHTKLLPPGYTVYPYFYHQEALFPLKLFIEGERAWVLDQYAGTPVINPGTEILSINGEPMSSIFRKLLPRLFSDGENLTFKYYELNRYFSAWYANLIETGESFQGGFEILAGIEGKSRNFHLPATRLDVLLEYEKQQEAQPDFDLSFCDSTAILRIPFFWNPDKGPSYKKFLKSSFREIDRRRCRNLVIDLRNNEGGKETYGSLLLAYLSEQKFAYYDHLEMTQSHKFSSSSGVSVPVPYRLVHLLSQKTDSGNRVWTGHPNNKMQKPKKPVYRGKLYVLINGGCFSVATEFLAVLKSMGRATLVGEETGGAYYGNNSGFFAIFRLPHSDLELGIPLISFYPAVKALPDKNRGVFPDQKVHPSLEGLIEHRDEVLERTMELIEEDMLKGPD